MKKETRTRVSHPKLQQNLTRFGGFYSRNQKNPKIYATKEEMEVKSMYSYSYSSLYWMNMDYVKA